MTVSRFIQKACATGKTASWLACVVLTLFALPARAACTSPAGNEGQMMYNADYHVMQYCNGTNWKAVGKLSSDINANRWADWKFDDGSGTTATDSSGNGRNGTLINGASWGAGQVNGAIFINASDDANDDNDPEIDLGTSFTMPSPPFTVAAWINPTDYNDWRTILGRRDIQDEGYFLWQLIITTGNVKFSSNAGTGNTFAYVPPTGVWTHLALVVTSTSMDLYVNGLFQENYTGAFALGSCGVSCHATIGDNGQVLSQGVGTGADGDPFKGYIDELRIYPRALSASEISTLYSYTGSTAGTCSGPAGSEGQMLYSQASHVLQYCDGTSWRATGPVPGLGGSGCTGPTGAEGIVMYDADHHVMSYCDGTNWYPMGRCSGGFGPFTNTTGVWPSTVTASNIVQLPVDFRCSAAGNAISISGSASPQFQICSDAACSSVVTSWTSSATTINAGQYVQVRQTSSGNISTAVSATLTIAGASATWVLTTRGPMRIFVTSTTTKGQINGTGGVTAGDTMCNNLATTAGLSGTYKAWLAVTTNTDDPNTRMTHPGFAFVDTAGTTIANDWTGLISGSLLAGISKNESGGNVAANTRVWTNVTASTGTTATVSGSGNNNCTGWTTNAGSRNGPYGLTGATNGSWTNSGSQSCNTNTRLYCVEQ